MDAQELQRSYQRACDALEEAIDRFEALALDTTASDGDVAAARKRVTAAEESATAAKARLELAKSGRTRITVEEPDMYDGKSRRFLDDLFAAQVKGNPLAAERIAKHHAYEVEKYAVATSTLGGIIPPQYLVDMYAKASRNGRVFADQCNHQDLPEQGMSLIVPRLTQGLAADIQATESTAAATQDPTETDLTVGVSTIAGYSPVSRQTLDRGAYSEAILFEDLIARYWAKLDVQCLNGSGSSGQFQGVIGQSSVKSSTVSTQTVPGTWPKIADVIQQINAATGGLGYVADKIVMHPRRWGFFEAALDSNNRPVFGISGTPYFNAAGEGDAAGYGLVGRMQGLPVYTDANIPTNLGSGTNEDWIIVMASSIVHLWERPGDPVALSFQEQAGTSLQVQLVAMGYSAFTAGRYPAAIGLVKGSTPPSF